MSQRIKNFRQGDTVRITIEYSPPIDITGFKFWFTLKNFFTDADNAAVLQVSTVPGNDSADDPAAGIVSIVVPAASTATVAPGSYFYDVQEKSQSGEIRTILPPPDDYKDKIKVLPQVTQAIV